MTTTFAGALSWVGIPIFSRNFCHDVYGHRAHVVDAVKRSLI